MHNAMYPTKMHSASWHSFALSISVSCTNPISTNPIFILLTELDRRTAVTFAGHQ